MQKFTDTLGRRWEVAITPATACAVREALGLDLPGLLEETKQPLAALLNDPPMLAAVLYVLCSKQASKSGIGPDEFRIVVIAAEQAATAFCQELFNTYCPLEDLAVRYAPAFDQAQAAIMGRSSQPFDTTIPTPPDPAVPRMAQERRG